MSNLTVFQFQQNQVVRTIFDKDGEPWFVAADVCAALGVQNPSDAIKRLDDDEKGGDSIDTLGGAQDMTVVNESGLHSLILGSCKLALPTTAGDPIRRCLRAAIPDTPSGRGESEPSQVCPMLRRQIAPVTEDISCWTAHVSRSDPFVSGVAKIAKIAATAYSMTSKPI